MDREILKKVTRAVILSGAGYGATVTPPADAEACDVCVNTGSYQYCSWHTYDGDGSYCRFSPYACGPSLSSVCWNCDPAGFCPP
jgi:hypothetical protein